MKVKDGAASGNTEPTFSENMEATFGKSWRLILGASCGMMSSSACICCAIMVFVVGFLLLGRKGN